MSPAEEDRFRVEPYVGVLEVPDAVGGGETWRASGIGVAGRTWSSSVRPGRVVELAAETSNTFLSRSRQALVVSSTCPCVRRSMSTGPGRGTEANWVANLRVEREGPSIAAMRRRPREGLSERLGHAPIAHTLETYQHVLLDMQEDAASTAAGTPHKSDHLRLAEVRSRNLRSMPLAIPASRLGVVGLPVGAFMLPVERAKHCGRV